MLILVATALEPAHAQTVGYKCWTRAQVVATGSLFPLRCRVGRSSVAELSARPVPLYPSVAEDLDGECWYERDDPTGWEVVSIGPDGAAVLDHFVGGTPGGPAVRVGTVRRCTGEPAVSLDERLVWQVLRGHRFSRPAPSLDPLRGITGLPAYLDLPSSGSVRYVFDNPETLEQLTLEIFVSHVSVDWGEAAEPLRYKAGAHVTSGYPGGTVRHVYESMGTFRVIATFEWVVRWREGGDLWYPVDVEPISGTTRYPVDQIVSRLTR